MAEVHLWASADAPQSVPAGGATAAELRQHAERHGAGAIVRRLRGRQNLWPVLNDISDRLPRRQAIDSLDFHTHGRPGEIIVGPDIIDVDFWRASRSRAHSIRFGVDAVVTFIGCDVANLAEGEYFLAEAAWTLLSAHGGQVTASTYYGLIDPTTGSTRHPNATEKTAVVRAGRGVANIAGAEFLRTDRIRGEVELWKQRFDTLRARTAGMSGAVCIEDGHTAIWQADYWINRRGERPSYHAVYRAYGALQRARDAARRLNGRWSDEGTFRPTFGGPVRCAPPVQRLEFDPLGFEAPETTH